MDLVGEIKRYQAFEMQQWWGKANGSLGWNGKKKAINTSPKNLTVMVPVTNPGLSGAMSGEISGTKFWGIVPFWTYSGYSSDIAQTLPGSTKHDKTLNTKNDITFTYEFRFR